MNIYFRKNIQQNYSRPEYQAENRRVNNKFIKIKIPHFYLLKVFFLSDAESFWIVR